MFGNVDAHDNSGVAYRKAHGLAYAINAICAATIVRHNLSAIGVSTGITLWYKVCTAHHAGHVVCCRPDCKSMDGTILAGKAIRNRCRCRRCAAACGC